MNVQQLIISGAIAAHLVIAAIAPAFSLGGACTRTTNPDGTITTVCIDDLGS